MLILFILIILALILLGGAYYAYRVAFYASPEGRNKAPVVKGTAYDPYREEMRRTADQMPPMEYSREEFMLWHWDMKGKEGLEKRQDYLYDMLIGLTEVMGILPGMI